MKAFPVVKSRIDSLLPWWVIGSVWLVLFGPMMTGLTVSSFRDSTYLYFPLFAALNQVWAAGEIPLWNPYCDFGFPTVADGTSSLFYPGKLLFGLPLLSFPARYGLYLGLHALLAAVGTYRFARILGCRRTGATLAAISFAFGGPLLVQTSNVIYLVSGAWLPWALLHVWTLVRDGSWPAGCKAGMIGALMILGGDPQMVYHVGLIAAVSVLIVSIQCWLASGPNTWQKHRGRVGARWVGLAGMVLTTSVLSAVQLIPTAELVARSERSAPGKVVNLYTAIGQAGRSAPVAGDPPTVMGDSNSPLAPLFFQDDQIVGQYQFSLPPWSWMELLIPNFSGRAYPVNQRWGDQLLASDRMWYPSLYMGLLVILVAFRNLRFRGPLAKHVWLSWIFLVFLLGSCGWYGATWLVREVATGLGSSYHEPLSSDASRWAAPVGGVYWWMSTLLPGYYGFRYPAKLFLVASLAISVLAGMGWGQDRQQLGLKTWVAVVALLAGVAAVATGLRSGWFQPGSLYPLTTTADSLFGDLDTAGAIRGLAASLIQALVVVTLGLVLGGKWCQPRSANARAWLLVVIVAADLLVANRWLLAEIPASSMTAVADPGALRSAALPVLPMRPVVVIGVEQVPDRFATPSPVRLQEWLAWQQGSLQPKHHLAHSVRVIGSFHSIWPQRYLDFVDQFQLASLSGSGVPSLATESTITLDRASNYGRVELDSGGWHWRELSNGPPAADRDQPRTLTQPSFEITGMELAWNRARIEGRVHPGETAGTVGQAWFELPLWGDSHWQCEVHQDHVPTTAGQTRVTADDLLEVRLPTVGHVAIDLEYRPRWLIPGLSISGLGWLLGLTGLGLCRFRSRRGPRHPAEV